MDMDMDKCGHSIIFPTFARPFGWYGGDRPVLWPFWSNCYSFFLSWLNGVPSGSKVPTLCSDCRARMPEPLPAD